MATERDTRGKRPRRVSDESIVAALMSQGYSVNDTADGRIIKRGSVLDALVDREDEDDGED